MSDRLAFCLAADPTQQEALRTLRLNGADAWLDLQTKDGRAVFLYDGKPAGAAPGKIQAWLDANGDKLPAGQVYSSVIGGGHRSDGAARPFTWYVNLKLSSPVIHPEDDVWVGAAASLEGFPSDCVCCISKTKKVHIYPPTCGASALGLPRAILDEIDLEEHSVCQKCFRSFW